MAEFFELRKEMELLALYIKNNIKQTLKTTFKYEEEEEDVAKLFPENKKLVLAVLAVFCALN